MIPVTKPFLPPIQEYEELLRGIWKREWLTNMGPLSSQLEIVLKNYLNVSHLLYVNNGTIALQMAIKALGIKDEVITTPFSFVATTSSLVWEGCTPVFVDIDQESLCIDINKIEEAITDSTTAILATHVYGNPCDVIEIDRIAEKYDLKVIYDAAHAFGVEINGKSIFEYGDISICSLHATKLYHSIEGGLLITKHTELLAKLAKIRNFGISGFDSFSELGINGKNSELHAAMGLINIKYISSILEKRKIITEHYDKKLDGFKAMKPHWRSFSTKNYAYYPLVFESEELLMSVKLKLDAKEIFARRYFYPSLACALPYLPSKEMKVADDISRRVLCLPIYFDLSLEDVDYIANVMLEM